MSRFVGAGEAARLLGVQKATLYAYVSRGLIERRVAVDGRTSLYAVDDVEALAGRGPPPARSSRARRSTSRSSPASPTLDEAGVRYLGHDVADLARTSRSSRSPSCCGPASCRPTDVAGAGRR